MNLVTPFGILRTKFQMVSSNYFILLIIYLFKMNLLMHFIKYDWA
jgi:hypothetical protein